MSPAANYRCRECGYTTERLFDGPPPPVHTMPHTNAYTQDMPCEGGLDRVWGGRDNAPSVGYVKHAGGSPPR